MSTSLRVIVTGSRDWPDKSAVWRALDTIAPTTPGSSLTIVHGACRINGKPAGADRDADEWVRRNRYRHGFRGCLIRAEPHPADWRRYRKAAGPIRNRHMVDLGADLVLAFVLNHSSGTTGCIELARAAGIEVRDNYLCTHQGPCPTPTPAAQKGA